MSIERIFSTESAVMFSRSSLCLESLRTLSAKGKDDGLSWCETEDEEGVCRVAALVDANEDRRKSKLPVLLVDADVAYV